MTATKIVVILLGIAVAHAVAGKDQVHCFASSDCTPSGAEELASEDDCCKHGVSPFGLAFKRPGTHSCIPCPVEFGFVESTLLARESGDDYQVNLAFFSGKANFGAFFVSIVYNGGTAAVKEDIDVVSSTIFIPEVVPQHDLQTSPVYLRYRQDRVTQEGNETFNLGFTYRDGTFGANAILRNNLSGVVLDATVVTFELTEADYREREGGRAGYMPIKITKTSNNVILAAPIYLSITPLTIGEALAQGVIENFEPENHISPNRADKEDFNSTRITVEFPAVKEQSDVNAPIRVFDDETDEADEQYFIAHLGVAHALDKDLVILQHITSTCEIVDNDAVRIGFQFQEYSYIEPNTSRIRINEVAIIKEDNKKSEQTFGILVTFGNPVQLFTAVEGSDYITNNSRNYTFGPDQTSINIEFYLLPDDLVEGAEGFRMTIDTRGSPFPRFLLPHFHRHSIPAFLNTLIKIIDSDIAVVGFEEPLYMANETSGRVQVCAVVTNPPRNETLAFPIRLQYTTRRLTADNSDFHEVLAPAVRYISFPGTTETHRSCSNIMILQDSVYESTESFMVELELAQGTNGVKIQSPVTEVQILDSNELIIGFISTTPYEVIEGNRLATVEFGILDGGMTTVDIEIQLVFSDQTAIGGSDYHNVAPQVFVFNSSVTKYTYNLSLINDNILEPTESLLANLSFVGTPSLPRATLLHGQVQIIIFDDEAENAEIKLERLRYQILERFNQQVCIIMRGFIQSSIIVVVNTHDGIADQSSDYIPFHNHEVVINQGHSKTCFTVSIVNDLEVEGSETFTISVQEPKNGLRQGIRIDATSNGAVIKIIDNDVYPSCFSFLRFIRPDLFDHCIVRTCTYSSFSRWRIVPNTEISVPQGLCLSGRAQEESRNQTAPEIGCAVKIERRQICILTDAQRLIHTLNLGVPVQSSNPSVPSEPIPVSNPTNSSRYKRQGSQQCSSATDVCQNNYPARNCIERPECKTGHGNNCTLRTLIFILDSSGSIGETEFNSMLGNLSMFVPLFCGDLQLAVVSYSTDIRVEFCFNCHSLSGICTEPDYSHCGRSIVKSSLENIPYLGGLTHTGSATRCVYDYILDPLSECQADNTSDCVDIIYITDGGSNGPLQYPQTCNEAKCLKNHPDWCGRVNTYAIGIGNARLRELECLTDNDEESVFQVSDTDDFAVLLRNATALMTANRTEPYTCANIKERVISLEE